MRGHAVSAEVFAAHHGREREDAFGTKDGSERFTDFVGELWIVGEHRGAGGVDAYFGKEAFGEAGGLSQTLCDPGDGFQDFLACRFADGSDGQLEAHLIGDDVVF